MSRKSIFTKDEIINKGFEMIKSGGMEVLTARNLASELGISTGPLFVAFSSFSEIQQAVVKKAKEFYKTNYYEEALKCEPKFKYIGLNYIKFAKEQPKLFRVVFSDVEKSEMSHFLPDCDETSGQTVEITENAYGINEEKAKKLFNHLSVYCYGLANLFADGVNTFTMDEVSNMLSEIFVALMGGNKK